MNNNQLTKKAFEQMYNDNSGVEYAVRLDMTDGDIGDIEFESCDKVQFPIDQIDWLISCLENLRKEINILSGDNHGKE